MPSSDAIFKMMEELGVNRDRLKEVLSYKDDWGKLVHSFEYLTVLSVVEEAWDRHVQEQYWKDPASQSQGD